MARKINS